MSIISIVGNIGAGKSYFCDRIRDLFPSVSVFNENIEGYKELVELYYKDKRNIPVLFRYLCYTERH
jgi:deoxyadenosine/deoxycytidine kinase